MVNRLAHPLPQGPQTRRGVAVGGHAGVGPFLGPGLRRGRRPGRRPSSANAHGHHCPARGRSPRRDRIAAQVRYPHGSARCRRRCRRHPHAPAQVRRKACAKRPHRHRPAPCRQAGRRTGERQLCAHRWPPRWHPLDRARPSAPHHAPLRPACQPEARRRMYPRRRSTRCRSACPARRFRPAKAPQASDLCSMQCPSANLSSHAPRSPFTKKENRVLSSDGKVSTI